MPAAAVALLGTACVAAMRFEPSAHAPETPAATSVLASNSPASLVPLLALVTGRFFRIKSAPSRAVIDEAVALDVVEMVSEVVINSATPPVSTLSPSCRFSASAYWFALSALREKFDLADNVQYAKYLYVHRLQFRAYAMCCPVHALTWIISLVG